MTTRERAEEIYAEILRTLAAEPDPAVAEAAAVAYIEGELQDEHTDRSSDRPTGMGA